MTFLQLQQLASDYLDDPNNGYFTLTMLKMRLNLALRELQKRLISANKDYYSTCVYTNTVVNQAAYALPSDFLQVIRLYYITQGSGTTASEQKLEPITPNQRDLLTDTSGDPGFYYMQKNNLILAPVPNRVLELHLEYSYQVADMSADADLPDAPSQFHEYIVLLAVRDCMVKDNRPLVNIETKLKEYEMLLKQIADQRQADKPRMIVQTSNMDWNY